MIDDDDDDDDEDDDDDDEGKSSHEGTVVFGFIRLAVSTIQSWRWVTVLFLVSIELERWPLEFWVGHPFDNSEHYLVWECLRPILKYHAIQSHMEESGMFGGGRKIVRYRTQASWKHRWRFGDLQHHVVRKPYVSKRCFLIWIWFMFQVVFGLPRCVQRSTSLVTCSIVWQNLQLKFLYQPVRV